MKNRPPYPLSSVDNALLLVHLLRDQGGVSVSEAAETLGVARSTAHRLLAMLVYRDFAVQDGSHTYRPGPSLFVSAVQTRPTRKLVKILLPHMQALRERHNETVQLSVRSGRWIRFIASVECAQFLRVGDRRGTALPALGASGGRALLAELSSQQLAKLYPISGARTPSTVVDDDAAHTDGEWNALVQAMDLIRRRGFALNVPDTEPGVRAVGVALHNERGEAVGALSIAAPVTRMPGAAVERLGADLIATARRAAPDLAGYRER
ncbi:MAG: IclR family transcriptional regulator [Rhodococcus sp. (in: high G+C Gram-positive bacteria)]|nr:MAG: IclR family transcriptional regulator [Rhodococcus sp. (in: high G+C Gram-positive bacteria)]